MLPLINKLLLFLFFPCIIISCTFDQEGNKQKKDLSNSASYNNTLPELTQEQQSAFDALNKLQTSTDEMNRFYSTFANIDQPCYPADTSFEVSQSELLIFMEQFISKHCQNLTPKIQNQLAKSTVLAQKKYTILHCTENKSNINYDEGLPMTGTWVMPGVLDRRDVILVW